MISALARSRLPATLPPLLRGEGLGWGSPISLVLVIAASRLAAAAPASLPADRGIDLPVRSAFAPVSGKADHAGLFVGINEFKHDPSLVPLQYAVNDAISTPHRS